MLCSKSIPLSRLVTDRKNPRKVKADKQAHDQLVGSIRAHELLQPLVVEPITRNNGEDQEYLVKAGNRRLLALREIHSDSNPDIPCRVLDPDSPSASGSNANAAALAENAIRQNMHPLDEAEAYSKLASDEAKGVEEVAAEFGVTPRYVRQRMKLASLAGVIKQAYRDGEIDTATAEAFTIVSTKKQRELWDSFNGQVPHAKQVRNMIENEWMDATHALFDVKQLPDRVVRQDLFNEEVLVQREAFLNAQADALNAERDGLLDDGWHEVIIGQRSELIDRQNQTREAEAEPDEATAHALEVNYQAYVKLEQQLNDFDEEDEDAADSIYRGMEELEEQEKEIRQGGTFSFDETTKANGIVLLAVAADGHVDRLYRVPTKQSRRSQGTPGSSGKSNRQSGGKAGSDNQPLPTSEQLSDRQMRTTYVHEALVVRNALLDDPRRRKMLMVLMLHPHVRRDAVGIQLRRNGVDEHVERIEGFSSSAHNAWQEQFEAVDPFPEPGMSELEAYQRLCDMADEQLDELIGLLIVRALDTNLTHTTPLIRLLAGELNVNVRDDWTPDCDWLNSYRKCQLAHLRGELRGPAYGQSSLTMKKSQLVDGLGELFANAVEGKVEDAKLAQRVNTWLPVNLRDSDVASE